MFVNCRINRNALTLFTLLIVCTNASADLIFSAPPREPVERGQKVYGTIADKLSEILHKKIVYEHPANWTEYTRNMRANKYDIIFDGPHFVAWRMKHLHHTPVVKLPGTLGFVIIAKDTDYKANSLTDLIGKSLCGIASPNLGTMVAYSIFNNPVIQPEIHVVKGGPREVLKSFLKGECHYAVLFDKFFKNVPPEKRKHTKIIATSDQLPNQTISVSTKFSEEDIKKISDYLTSSAGSNTGKELLNFYSKKNPKFVVAHSADYDGLENLLEGVVFGWQ